MKSCPSVVCCETSSWLVMKTGHEGRRVLAETTDFLGGTET